MSWKKKSIKDKAKEERKEYVYYDIVKTSDRKSTVIPKLVDGEGKVPFDSVEAETFLRRCVNPMITEAARNIKSRVNDKSYYSDFVACFARMSQVFVDNFSFALFVEKYGTAETAYLSLKTIEPGTVPLFESTVYYTKGTRDDLVRYIEAATFREELFLTMTDLMHKHHKELLRLQAQ